MKCPECGKEIKPLSKDDEDEWWSECPECHATWGHSIKPGFG
jgi:DNA-directed RNA polymerase subunit RPC12/RpoP